MKKLILLVLLVIIAVSPLSAEALIGQLVTSVDDEFIPTYGEYWIELATESEYILKAEESVLGDSAPTPLDLVTDGKELYIFRVWFVPEGAEPQIMREEFAVSTEFSGYRQGAGGTYKQWTMITPTVENTFELTTRVYLTAPEGLDGGIILLMEQTGENGEIVEFTFFGRMEGAPVAASANPDNAPD